MSTATATTAPDYSAHADRPGAVCGPEANAGDGGTIAYVCDTVGDTAAQHSIASRIARALNEQDELLDAVRSAHSVLSRLGSLNYLETRVRDELARLLAKSDRGGE